MGRQRIAPNCAPRSARGALQVEAREFNLARRRRHGERVDHKIVERAVVLELERAERVGDPFEGVGHRVRVVVHRVHLPLVARHRVDGVALDPVDRRVAEVEVWRRHVNLESEEGKEASE